MSDVEKERDATARKAGFSHGQEIERACTVAWLREDVGKTRTDLTRLHAGRKLTASQTAEWEGLIALKSGIADAIERGDHLTTGDGGEG